MACRTDVDVYRRSVTLHIPSKVSEIGVSSPSPSPSSSLLFCQLLAGCVTLSLHCVSAPVMWVKVCPILKASAQIRNQVRLGSLRRYISAGPAAPCGLALTSLAPGKRDRRSRNDEAPPRPYRRHRQVLWFLGGEAQPLEGGWSSHEVGYEL